MSFITHISDLSFVIFPIIITWLVRGQQYDLAIQLTGLHLPTFDWKGTRRGATSAGKHEPQFTDKMWRIIKEREIKDQFKALGIQDQKNDYSIE